MTQTSKIPENSDLVEYMRTSNRVWYKSIDLLQKFGKSDLNEAYMKGLIEIRGGINVKVLKLK